MSTKPSDWDPRDLRVCGGCRRPMRHRHAEASWFDVKTVMHGSGSDCKPCRKTFHDSLKGGTKESEEARLAMARQIQQEIRARRQRLGITPDGRKLPRRVLVG